MNFKAAESFVDEYSKTISIKNQVDEQKQDAMDELADHMEAFDLSKDFNDHQEDDTEVNEQGNTPSYILKTRAISTATATSTTSVIIINNAIIFTIRSISF